MRKKSSKPRARCQGSLDGLCGVYSVVNSVIHIAPRPLGREDVQDLFRTLCRALAEEGRLEDALVDGMTIRVLCRLIDRASELVENQKGFALQRRMAFATDPDGGLNEFWQRLTQHLEETGPGSVLLGLGGKHDHWTCVDRISETRIDLIDSDDLRWLNRKSCTVANQRGARKHVLWPTQTVLLRPAA